MNEPKKRFTVRLEDGRLLVLSKKQKDQLIEILKQIKNAGMAESGNGTGL